MASPDLGLAVKGVSKSCVFDFPDRPVRPTPPTDGGGNPLPHYPYDPVDDWPPPILPTPGSDPHPLPPPDPNFPSNSPAPGFFQEENWFASDGTGLRNTFGAPPWTANLGVDANIFASIDGSKEFAPRTVCAPILLSETGFDYTTGNYQSGLFIYGASLGVEWVVYVSYYLRFIQGLTDVTVFAPCSLTGPGSLPQCRVTDHANFSISSSWWAGPGTTPVDKTYETGAIKLSDHLVSLPLGFIFVG